MQKSRAIQQAPQVYGMLTVCGRHVRLEKYAQLFLILGMLLDLHTYNALRLLYFSH